jgi:hypothetical protein
MITDGAVGFILYKIRNNVVSYERKNSVRLSVSQLPRKAVMLRTFE